MHKTDRTCMELFRSSSERILSQPDEPTKPPLDREYPTMHAFALNMKALADDLAIEDAISIKHSDFVVGEMFYVGVWRWKCVKVLEKTIRATRIDHYNPKRPSKEWLEFDDDDIDACTTKPFEKGRGLLDEETRAKLVREMQAGADD